MSFPVRLRAAPALVAVAVLTVTGCESTPDPADRSAAESAATVPAGWKPITTDLGALARPAGWKPVPDAAVKDRVAGFQHTLDGEVVGQLDVFVNAFDPPVDADTVDAAIQAQRMFGFADLEHTRRDFVDVPGAASGFVTESRYTHAQTGEEVRSVDQVAVTDDGDYLLVRYSARADVYDDEVADQVLASMTLRR